MAASLRRLDRLLPVYRTRREPAVIALALAAGLLFGLVGVVPAFTLLVRESGVALPLPQLVGVGAVLFAYTAVVVCVRRVLLGTAVSLLVLSTFAANVPLTASATAYPGELGPQVWLFEGPLIALFGYYVLEGRYARRSFELPEIAFGLFVVWSVLAAVLGEPFRLDTALYYAAFVAVLWTTFTVSARTVRTGTVTLRTVASVLVLTACAHAFFGVVEFSHQASFELSYLGETLRPGTGDTLTTGPLEGYRIGTFISAFTGGSGQLSAVLVLVTPVAFAFAFDERGWRRVPPLAATGLLVGVVRLASKDAARIAVLVGLALFCALWLWGERGSIVRDPLRSLGKRLVPVASTLVIATSAVLFPSTTSGAVPESVASPNDRGTSTANGGGETAIDGLPPGSASTDHVSTNATGTTAGTTPSNATPTAGIEPTSVEGGAGLDVASLSIPYLSLNSLGVRLEQYAAGVHVAIGHPLFGIGGANYPFVAPRYGLPARLGTDWFSLHNQYLAVLVGTGVPGFLAYATAVAAVVYDSWNAIRARRGDEVIYLGVFAGLLGYLALAFWTVGVRYVLVVPFWVLAGAVVGSRYGTKGS